MCKADENDFVKFPRKAKNESRTEEDTPGRTFYLLKSSQMQVFNSFSKDMMLPYLAQTVCQAGQDRGNSAKGSDGMPKTCCNCKKSRCLKLYCECFFNKTYCRGCRCENCLNTEENEEERNKAMEATLVRNPVAFEPKILLKQVTSSLM